MGKIESACCFKDDSKGLIPESRAETQKMSGPASPYESPVAEDLRASRFDYEGFVKSSGRVALNHNTSLPFFGETWRAKATRLVDARKEGRRDERVIQQMIDKEHAEETYDFERRLQRLAKTSAETTKRPPTKKRSPTPKPSAHERLHDARLQKDEVDVAPGESVDVAKRTRVEAARSAAAETSDRRRKDHILATTIGCNAGAIQRHVGREFARRVRDRVTEATRALAAEYKVVELEGIWASRVAATSAAEVRRLRRRDHIATLRRGVDNARAGVAHHRARHTNCQPRGDGSRCVSSQEPPDPTLQRRKCAAIYLSKSPGEAEYNREGADRQSQAPRLAAYADLHKHRRGKGWSHDAFQRTHHDVDGNRFFRGQNADEMDPPAGDQCSIVAGDVPEKNSAAVTPRAMQAAQRLYPTKTNRRSDSERPLP